jgi:hypothetical protein
MPTFSSVSGRIAFALLGFGFSVFSPRVAAANKAESFAGTGRVDTFGYAQCVLLENDATRVVLCHQAGGRVLEYSLHGRNSLWLDPQQQGWVLRPDVPAPDLCGGRFDIGPEMIVPRRPALWLGAWRAEVIGPRTARLTSEEDPATGVQLVRDFKLDAMGSRLWCTQTIRNISQRSTTWCHWSRTLAVGGGIAIVPLTPPSRFPQGYVRYDPGNLINFRPSDPNIRERDGCLEVFGPPKSPKLGMDSQAGWLAYLVPNNLLFVKRFPVYPDRVYNEVAALTISIWYDRDVRCELEPIGPMEKLAPGAAASFTEEWELAEFPFPAAGQAVDLRQVTATAAKRTRE